MTVTDVKGIKPVFFGVENKNGIWADEIESSGYVVDTLEAALWCLANTNSYRECLLWAVNLGEDADTVAAVAGSLAGLYYGYDSIPHEWLAGLKNKEMIVRVCG